MGLVLKRIAANIFAQLDGKVPLPGADYVFGDKGWIPVRDCVYDRFPVDSKQRVEGRGCPCPAHSA